MVPLAVKRDTARYFREHPTPAEARLWSLLADVRARHRVIRQALVCGYVADLYFPAARLVVEVDGPYHEGREASDALRDQHMARRGIRVVRVTNGQVFLTGAIVEQIGALVDERVALLAKRTQTRAA